MDNSVYCKILFFSAIFNGVLCTTRSYINTVQFIKSNDYPCEIHNVTTKDNYIITLQRIPKGRSSNNDTRSTVLLVHGLGTSSAEFVNHGVNKSLAYLLADNGFDVWLMNNRGVSWSRKHKYLDVVKNPEAFFNFSWHEMGIYDMPNTVDYILNITNSKNMQIVCYSQGCSQFIVMMDEYSEYNKKISLVSMLAPATFVSHLEFDMIFKQGGQILFTLEKELPIYEMPFLKQLRTYFTQNCGKKDIFSVLCRGYFNSLANGIDNDQLEEEFMPIISMNLPESFSIKQIHHYLQLIASKTFAKYNYGKKENLDRYGTETPPSYNFSKVEIPVALYFGHNDNMVGYNNIFRLKQLIKNVVHSYNVPNINFHHLDFMWAKDVAQLLYYEVISQMQMYD